MMEEEAAPPQEVGLEKLTHVFCWGTRRAHERIDRLPRRTARARTGQMRIKNLLTRGTCSVEVSTCIGLRSDWLDRLCAWIRATYMYVVSLLCSCHMLCLACIELWEKSIQ